MQRVIVVCDDETFEVVTDFLHQNDIQYECELSHPSDPLPEQCAYENLCGFTAEFVRSFARDNLGIPKLSVMNAHRVLDRMDDDNFNYSDENITLLIQEIVREHPPT